MSPLDRAVIRFRTQAMASRSSSITIACIVAIGLTPVLIPFSWKSKFLGTEIAYGRAYQKTTRTSLEHASMIGGLVVHLAQDDSLARQATSAMREQPGLDVGEQTGQRLPVVAESTECQSVEDTTEWLRNLPGVVHVDVVFVHLEEELLSEEQGTSVPIRTTFRNAE